MQGCVKAFEGQDAMDFEKFVIGMINVHRPCLILVSIASISKIKYFVSHLVYIS